jgi:hypothetical protein
MVENNRKNMPNPSEILTFWADRLLEKYPDKIHMDIFYEPIEMREKIACCFACGSELGTERCHILPLNQGGDNSLENLHLLCKECHWESEGIHGEIYWEWFKCKNHTNSGSNLRLMNKFNIVVKMLENGQVEEVIKQFPLLEPIIKNYFQV